MAFNIFKEAKSKHTNTTMLEVSDKSREHEYEGYSADSYISLFVGFLESLGYEPNYTYKGSSTIRINGVEFYVDIKNASYNSKNAYTREKSIRKPENRFIKLVRKYLATTVIKVHFNKELDADKLRRAVDKAIQEDVDKNREIEIRLVTNENNTIELANHYLSNAFIKEAVEYINIEKGVIKLSLKNSFVICLKSNGDLLNVNYCVPEMNKAKEVFSLLDKMADTSRQTKVVLSEILSHPKPPISLSVWAETHYHGYFYTATMSTKRN